MKCQKCNQNEANVQYRETINGETREIFLCTECARESGILKNAAGMFESMQRELMGAFSFPFSGHRLISSAFGNSLASPLSDFSDFFETDPVESLDSIQAPEKEKHEKSRKVKQEKKSVPETVDELKSRLLDAIADERYEDAAKLRDKIKKLKGE